MYSVVSASEVPLCTALCLPLRVPLCKALCMFLRFLCLSRSACI